jgi:hypothetical protein
MNRAGQLPAEELPTLQEIQQEYEQALPAISSLSYRVERKWIERRKLPAEVRLFDPIEYEQVQYWNSGNKVALQIESTSRSGKDVSEEWAGFNGRTYASWRHSLQAPEGLTFPSTGRISLQTPGEFRGRLLETFTGRSWLGKTPEGEDSLLKRLSQPESRVIGWEPVGEFRCVVVEAVARSGSPSVSPVWKVWLDPQRSYLPRRIRPLHATGESQSDAWWDNDVLDFQQVIFPNGSHGWLPARCVSRSSDGYIEWQLTFSDFLFNVEIPEEMFEPDFPFGTLVYDETSVNRDRTSFVGGAAGAERYRELDEAYQTALAKLRPQLQLQAASHPAPVAPIAWGFWLIILCSVSLLACGYVIYRRRTAA